jgi:hypothetical protein
LRRAGASAAATQNVTVPLTNRQKQIEEQIDELDRRSAPQRCCTILLGPIGYWMAERIADPVNRLTRATVGLRGRSRRSDRSDFI